MKKSQAQDPSRQREGALDDKQRTGHSCRFLAALGMTILGAAICEPKLLQPELTSLIPEST
jgi:hypothetical protein